MPTRPRSSMPSSASSSGRAVAAVLAVCAVVAVTRAAPSNPPRVDPNDPPAWSGSDPFDGPPGDVSWGGSVSDDRRRSDAPLPSLDDFDLAILDHVSAWLDSDRAAAADPLRSAAARSDAGDLRAPSGPQIAALPSPADPEPVLDGERRSEAELFAGFVPDGVPRWHETDYGSRPGGYAPAECGGRPRSEAAESDRPRKRARIAAAATADPIRSPESGPAVAPTELRTPFAAGATESDAAAVVPAVRPGPDADPSGAGIRPDPGPVPGRYSPYAGRPVRMIPLAERVWQAIVRKGLHDEPRPTARDETRRPDGAGAVPHLVDHSDPDRVMSHYARWFGPTGQRSPHGNPDPADAVYGRSLALLINCRVYHCDDSADEFLDRHRGFDAARFDRWCSGVDDCNHREKTLQRFRAHFRARLVFSYHPALNDDDDLGRIQARLRTLIAANPDKVLSQAEKLRSAQSRPSDPARVPRLNDLSSMDLVLAHYAAVFGPDGTHSDDPSRLHDSDLTYHQRLARLLHCFFHHSRAVLREHYARYGAGTPDSWFLLCNGVDECNGGWAYADQLGR